MKKILKISVIVLLLFFVVLMILPFAFKGKIIQTIKVEMNKNLKAKVNFDDVSLSFIRNFPDLNIGVESLTIVGVDTFKLDTLANIPKLSVTIDLMSVFKGENYKIKKILLKEPKILLKALADPKLKPNWDIMISDTTAAKDTTPSAFKMTLQKFEIVNGTIIYDDATFPVYTKLEQVDYSLKGDFTADFSSLSMNTTIKQVDVIYNHVKYLSQANAELKATVDADLKHSNYTIKESDIRLNELYLGVNGMFTMLAQGYDMDLKFSAKKNEFKNFLSMIPAVYAKNFSDIKTAGSLALDGYVKGIYNDNTMPGFALRIMIQNAMFQYPSLPKQVNNIQLDSKIECKTGKFDDTEIRINKLHCELAGNPIDVRLLVLTPVSDAQINGNIKGKIDLTTVKDFYPLEKDVNLNGVITADISMNGRMSAIEQKKYEDFKALGKLGISGVNYKSKDYPQGIYVQNMNLDFTPQQVNLTNLNVKIGKSDLSAKGRIDNLIAYMLKNETLRGNLETSSQLLDLNEMMGSSTHTTQPDTTKLSVIEIPGNIDFTLSATFKRLLYDKMDMSDVAGLVKIKDKRLTIENLKLFLLDGQLGVKGFYETVNPKQPQMILNLDIKQFDIPSAFKTFTTIQKLVPVAEKTKGKFSTTLSLATLLDIHMMPVYKTLTAKGILTTSKIIVENTAAQNKIAGALKMDKFKKMLIENLKLNYKIENGQLYVDPYDFKLDNIKSTIAGSTSLDQKINYNILFAIPRSEFGGQANSVLTGLVSEANKKGANFSVGDVVNAKIKLTGTVTNPTVGLALGESSQSVKQELKQQAQAEYDKKKKELEDKAKAEAEAKQKALESQAKTEADRLKKEADAKAEKVKKDAEEKLKKQLKKIF